MAGHCKTFEDNEEDLKDKAKVPIINKIANVIEKELINRCGARAKVTFFQAIAEILERLSLTLRGRTSNGKRQK